MIVPVIVQDCPPRGNRRFAMLNRSRVLQVAALVFVVTACTTTGKHERMAESRASAVVLATDRSDADRKLDEARKPVELLTFIGVKSGARILDIGAGNGYTTELLARAAGPEAQVWGQNDRVMIEKYVKAAFDDRAAGFKGARLNKYVSAFDNPVPPGAAPLDLVTIVLFYHDIAYLPVDRALMLKRLYTAMKPGASLIVIDHSAKAGEGIKGVQNLHRIEEASVRSELASAGFEFVADADFWRNPRDARDQPFFKMAVPTDQFALKFMRR